MQISDIIQSVIQTIWMDEVKLANFLSKLMLKTLIKMYKYKLWVYNKLWNEKKD